MENKIETAKKEEELKIAEEALKKLKAQTGIKIGSIPFIAGASEKGGAPRILR